MYFEATDPEKKWDYFTSTPTHLVVDYIGIPKLWTSPKEPDRTWFHRIMERKNVWLKLTCRERLSNVGPPPSYDFTPFARCLMERFPNMVLWGTDWPHPNLNMVAHMPDDSGLVGIVLRVAITTREQQLLFLDNPMRLYWPEEIA